MDFDLSLKSDVRRFLDEKHRETLSKAKERLDYEEIWLSVFVPVIVSGMAIGLGAAGIAQFMYKVPKPGYAIIGGAFGFGSGIILLIILVMIGCNSGKEEIKRSLESQGYEKAYLTGKISDFSDKLKVEEDYYLSILDKQQQRITPRVSELRKRRDILYNTEVLTKDKTLSLILSIDEQLEEFNGLSLKFEAEKKEVKEKYKALTLRYTEINSLRFVLETTTFMEDNKDIISSLQAELQGFQKEKEESFSELKQEIGVAIATSIELLSMRTN